MNAFKKNLLIGYSVSILLLAISSIASFVSIRNLLNASELVNETNNTIRSLDAVMLAAKDGEAGQRGYLLTKNAAFLGPYKGAYDRAISAVDDVSKNSADDLPQQQNISKLRNLVSNRFAIMQSVVDDNKLSGHIDSSFLEKGREQMEELRILINAMVNRENAILKDRTETMNKFASSTPLLIIVASFLAIMITIASFIRVNSDFKRKEEMQQELIKKENEITNRIRIIEGIANKIASGDYNSRIDDEGRDTLGSLGTSLNKMAANLEKAFNDLSYTEWQQTGIAKLNDMMIGEKKLEKLSHNVIGFLTEYLSADIGAIYLTADQQFFTLSAGVGIDQSKAKNLILGEGVAGRCASTRKMVLVTNVNDDHIVLNYSAGSLKPKTIVAFPVFYEERLKAVIELASLREMGDEEIQFLQKANFGIGTAIHSARDHKRLQELLEETQAQSEELQAQHSELESINAELETQSEKLQASEEELRVQQEELQQANQELEERSRLLEERNEIIQERNFDIQAKAEQLEQSTRYKSEFLANMSHELRTPLNSILLLSRLLSENHEGNLSDDQIDYAKVIQGSGNGLLRLIDEILDLSKIESGKMELEFHPVSLPEMVSELKGLFDAVATEKNVGFEINVDDAVPSTIETDKMRLEQIIRNLVANALKFTTEGKVSIDIGMANKNNIQFAVKDTGIGIPIEKHNTIFEAFQQADGSTRRKYGGTGLGLSISRELAKLLGGEITLQSVEGKGSTFTLIIPLLKDIKAAVPKQEILNVYQPKKEESIAELRDKTYISDVIPASIPDDRETINETDKVILIIDDDTSFAKSLLDYTRQKGYKGIVAVRGDEGIDLARKFLPIGILLDLQLPVKSGWEVMDELKKDPHTRPIPIHMMSSHQVHRKSISSGAIDFINKPVAFEKMTEIFQRIEDALNRHPRKVLIVEENAKHAEALSYFLGSANVLTEITGTVNEGINALKSDKVDCVILDMGVPAQHSYDTLEAIRKTEGLENLPIIIFTGKNISNVEEMRIKKYADSIVIKTAHSYQRILDEVSLFLHLVEENKKDKKISRYKNMGSLQDVLKGKTVLIADDDVRNIFSLTRALETHGIAVISAMDGKDAIRQLNENPHVDLVLMDMMMPEMDGYQSTARMREMPQYRNLPIIAVTAKAMTGDREKCINAGASDYITKPVDIDQLLSLLRVWLYNGNN